MTLKEHIDDIRDRLKEGELPPNEAAVCDDIVRRIVHELGWPRFQSRIVYPQYPVEGGKVDFALWHPPSEPCVFIEAKQVGGIENADAEEQLFRYAFRRGVPIAILTDGQKWQFFYPMAEVDYRERKVHELDLIQDDSEESAKRLNRYLNYESIRMGKAVEAIKEDYEKVIQQKQVATQFPDAWSKLLEEADEFLLDVVAEKTESLCGYRPTNEQVLDFLKSLKSETESPVKKTPSSPISSVQPLSTPRRGPRTQKALKSHLVVTMPNGDKVEDRNATNTFCEVIEKIGIASVSSLNFGLSAVSLITPIGDWYGTYQSKRESKCGRYYITTQGSVATLAAKLKEIAEGLGVNMKVDP